MKSRREKTSIACVFIISIFLFVFLSSSQVLGDISISGGDLTIDQIWHPDGIEKDLNGDDDFDDPGEWIPGQSPYIIQGSITVKSNTTENNNPNIFTTLKITTERYDGLGDEGFEIKFNAGCKITIGSYVQSTSTYKYGALDAQGVDLDNNFIKFTRNSTGNWGGLIFAEATKSAETKLKYCKFEYGGSDSANYHYGNINVMKRDLFEADNSIQYCTFSNSMHAGIYVDYADPFIEDCTISNNTEDGIYVFRPVHNPDIVGAIRRCNIINNVNGIKLRTNAGTNYFLLIEDNNDENDRIGIANNTDYGIKCEAGIFNAELKNNTFKNNDGPYPLRIPITAKLHNDNEFINDDKAMEIELIGYSLSENKTLYEFPNVVAYNIRETNIGVGVTGTPGSPETLTIEAGTTIKFDSGLGIAIGGGPNWDPEYGKVIAVGDADNPIIFTTSEPGQYWAGISFIRQSCAADSRFDYCTIEYGGNTTEPYNANLAFYKCSPTVDTIKNSTIRYSISNGIKIDSSNENMGYIHNCDLYGNGLREIIDTRSTSPMRVNAERNYWGTPNGPSQDFCSSSVVYANVDYKPWLEEPFSEPFRFNAASVSDEEFNPTIESVIISFTLTGAPPEETPDWTLNILDGQFEKVWSTSGSGSSGSVEWDGIGYYGVVSGLHYYEIEAECSAGTASPVMGILNQNVQDKAHITLPLSHSQYNPDVQSTIDVIGTADFVQGSGNNYKVFYSADHSPYDWTQFGGGTVPVDNNWLATLSIGNFDQPAYLIKLEVTTALNTFFSDVVTIELLLEEEPPSSGGSISYVYDALHRLKNVTYHDEGMIEYSYDDVGNRLQEQISTEGELLTLKEKKKNIQPALISFNAQPRTRGVVLNWETNNETSVKGFNLYRKKQGGKRKYERINESIILSSGQYSGSSYIYTDVPPQSGGKWIYLLEVVRDSGKNKISKPIAVRNISIIDETGEGAFKKSFDVKCD